MLRDELDTKVRNFIIGNPTQKDEVHLCAAAVFLEIAECFKKVSGLELSNYKGYTIIAYKKQRAYTLPTSPQAFRPFTCVIDDWEKTMDLVIKMAQSEKLEADFGKNASTAVFRYKPPHN